MYSNEFIVLHSCTIYSIRSRLTFLICWVAQYPIIMSVSFVFSVLIYTYHLIFQWNCLLFHCFDCADAWTFKSLVRNHQGEWCLMPEARSKIEFNCLPPMEAHGMPVNSSLPFFIFLPLLVLVWSPSFSGFFFFYLSFRLSTLYCGNHVNPQFM